MSKITNNGLTRYGIGCFIAVPIWQPWASCYLYEVELWNKPTNNSMCRPKFNTLKHCKRLLLA